MAAHTTALVRAGWCNYITRRDLFLVSNCRYTITLMCMLKVEIIPPLFWNAVCCATWQTPSIFILKNPTYHQAILVKEMKASQIQNNVESKNDGVFFCEITCNPLWSTCLRKHVQPKPVRALMLERVFKSINPPRRLGFIYCIQ